MGQQAGWFRDPLGVGEQRYWDGRQWTDHVLVNGEQRVAPVSGGADAEIQDAVIVSETAPVQQFQSAPTTAPPVVERGPALTPDQQPSSTRVLWEGQRESITSSATQGRITSAKYRLTEDAVQFEAGLLSTRAETIPVWLIIDVDLTQSITQKARSVGDLTLRLGEAAEQFGQRKLVLESIRDARMVRDLIIGRANDMRTSFEHRQHQMEIERRTASSSSVNVGVHAPTAVPDQQPALPQVTDDSSRQAMIDQLRQLGELRDLGVLTEEEFQEQKRQLLG